MLDVLDVRRCAGLASPRRGPRPLGARGDCVANEHCADIVPALDAWTLEWLSESDQIHVEVNTADWPFLAYAPELQSVLVQRLAYDQLSFQTSTQADIVRDVRFVAKRSEALWDDALKRAFDNAEGLAKRRDSAR